MRSGLRVGRSEVLSYSFVCWHELYLTHLYLQGLLARAQKWEGRMGIEKAQDVRRREPDSPHRLRRQAEAGTAAGDTVRLASVRKSCPDTQFPLLEGSEV